jgi:hypothetical protein
MQGRPGAIGANAGRACGRRNFGIVDDSRFRKTTTASIGRSNTSHQTSFGSAWHRIHRRERRRPRAAATKAAAKKGLGFGSHSDCELQNKTNPIFDPSSAGVCSRPHSGHIEHCPHTRTVRSITVGPVQNRAHTRRHTTSGHIIQAYKRSPPYKQQTALAAIPV